MANVWLIAKKELKRFFGDKRMIFSSVILPIVMIYILYSVMGNVIGSEINGEKNQSYTIATVNAPSSIKSILESDELGDVQIAEYGTSDIDKQKDEVQNSKIDLLMIFPLDFDEDVAAYDVKTSSGYAPDVEIFYNSSSTNSSNMYDMMLKVLDSYEATLVNKFDINREVSESDLADQSDITKMMLSLLMPLLIVIMLFSMCMSTASESIAGEKERGTMATLLATPIKRSSIVMGKIVGMSITSIVSAFALFLGLAFTVPNYSKAISAGEGSLDISAYTPMDLVWLLLLIITLSLLFISFVSIFSTLASSIKEAATYTAPFTILVAVGSVFSMFSQGSQSSIATYFIPVYNVSQSMVNIFSGEYNITDILVTIISNLVYAFIFVQIIAILFKNEKVMFNK